MIERIMRHTMTATGAAQPEPVDMPKDDELHAKVRAHPGFQKAWKNRHQDVDALQDIVGQVTREHRSKQQAEASENPTDRKLHDNRYS